MLAVLGFTVGILLTFVPDAPRYSYWIAMTDMPLMEVVIGTYLIYNLFLSTKRATSEHSLHEHFEQNDIFSEAEEIPRVVCSEAPI